MYNWAEVAKWLAICEKCGKCECWCLEELYFVELVFFCFPFFFSWILLCLCKLETLLIPQNLWVLLFFFSCFLLFSSILFFIFWIRSYVYASVLSLSPSLGLYAAISCMPVVFLFVRFLSLFYTSIYLFSWSWININTIVTPPIVTLLPFPLLLSFHFLFLFDSFHYQTLSLHF